MGRKEFNRIIAAFGHHRRKILPSKNKFTVADAVYESLGKITIPIGTPPGIPRVFVEIEIVNAEIPALLGMDIMNKGSITPCIVSNGLAKRVLVPQESECPKLEDEWSIPIRRSRSSQLYVDMDISTSMFFTKPQISRLHRQFYHPSVQKLFNILKRARPNELISETLETLKDLSCRCNPCQRIQHARTDQSYRRSRRHSVQRNVFMDIMVIDGNPILHIVEEATKYGAARFLTDVSTDLVWKTFVEYWASIYTGLQIVFLLTKAHNSVTGLSISPACPMWRLHVLS